MRVKTNLAEAALHESDRFAVVGAPRMRPGFYGVLDTQTGSLVRSVKSRSAAQAAADEFNQNPKYAQHISGSAWPTESKLREMAMTGSEYPAVVRGLVQGIHAGELDNPERLIDRVSRVAPGSVGKRVSYMTLLNELARQLLRDSGLMAKLDLPTSVPDAVEALQEKFRQEIIRFMTYMERTAPDGGGYARYM